MAEEKVVVTMEDYEQRLAVKGLMEFRTDLLEEDMPTEDLDELILKIIDAPTRKEKRKADREPR